MALLRSCCTTLRVSPFASRTSASSASDVGSRFLGSRKTLSWVRPTVVGPSNGSRGFGIRSLVKPTTEDWGLWYSIYYNYMGMLAVEGTYHEMEALLNQDIHPVDILLMMAASEGDKPKVEELLRARAKFDVKDADGRTALDQETKEFILGYMAQKS